MKIINIIFILGISLNSFAQIPFRLPAIISNHAVLQQSSAIKLWGWGPGSMKVAIVCSWSPMDTASVLIGGDCRWEAKVKTPKAGGSYSIEFRCNNQVTKVEDILIGEVWLCSGQSNMELPTKVGILDDADVLKNCYNNQIRFFEVEKDFDKYPKSECKGEWKICDSATLSSFSAVAYFFGRRLNGLLNVPVGLIGSYWGGTNIGSWCSNEVVENDRALQNNNREGVPYAPQANSIIYNAMIVPLAPFKLAGVIWYQGESNVWPDPQTYGQSFANMIFNWRQLFETELPFYFVQIAPFRGFYPGIYSAYLREQQEAAVVVPKTGMVAIGDLAEIDVTDIHPRSKAGVGLRLANLALKEVYQKNDIQPYFPRFAEANFSKNIARVKVNSMGKLKCKGDEIRSFEVAGSDRKFYAARAKIEKDGTITISSKEVPLPVSVRYCFTNDQVPNLFDVNGLPLMPFRTDRWEVSLRTWQGIPGIERSAREPSPEQIDPKEAADKVMARLIKVTAPEVKGAHDAGLAIKGDHAFIVSMVNDVRADENPAWPEIYLTLSIVNLKTLVMEKNIPFAKGGQVFENDTLQIGACFVPRILLINDTTLRCFFASENPGVRQSQTFYRDFHITRQKFEDQIQKVKIKTSSGIFDMQPQYLYADAKVYGFTKPATDFGLYLIDAFKLFDGKIYAVLNNFSSGQNSLALVHDNGELFEVIGHYNLPNELKLSESSVNRLPDGTWMAICRQEGGNNNYLFTYSADGKIWSPGKELPIIPNGTNSKPTFDRFGGIYYLGWQEATKIQGVNRSVFNVDISHDGKNWVRKYRFESEKSFQYPSFYEYNGNIWLTVTQGDTDVSRKERIMFGKLE